MIYSADALQRILQSYFEVKFPTRQAIRISTPQNMTAGLGHEIFSFDCDYRCDGMQCRDGLVMRIYSGDGAHLASQREFVGMQRLHNAKFPIPRVHALECSQSPIGDPFILMDRIGG